MKSELGAALALEPSPPLQKAFASPQAPSPPSHTVTVCARYVLGVCRDAGTSAPTPNPWCTILWGRQPWASGSHPHFSKGVPGTWVNQSDTHCKQGHVRAHISLPIKACGSESQVELGLELLLLHSSRARIPGGHGHLRCQLLPPRME